MIFPYRGGTCESCGEWCNGYDRCLCSFSSEEQQEMQADLHRMLNPGPEEIKRRNAWLKEHSGSQMLKQAAA